MTVRFVKQTTVGGTGDCLNACIASITGESLASMPTMVDLEDRLGNGAAWRVLFGLLRRRGWRCRIKEPYERPSGYSVAIIEVPRKWRTHACVAEDGVVVFDPMPEPSPDTDYTKVLAYVEVVKVN
jgi:hypothetical protein